MGNARELEAALIKEYQPALNNENSSLWKLGNNLPDGLYDSCGEGQIMSGISVQNPAAYPEVKGTSWVGGRSTNFTPQ